MATILGLKLFRRRNVEAATRPNAEASLLSTFSTMVQSGELDSGDAEERFAEILARARGD